MKTKTGNESKVICETQTKHQGITWTLEVEKDQGADGYVRINILADGEFVGSKSLGLLGVNMLEENYLLHESIRDWKNCHNKEVV